MELFSIFFGAFLGLFVPTSAKAMQQTLSIWRRTRSLRNAYLYMIWVEATVNLIFAVATYLYLCKVIRPSFAFYFGTAILWAFQTQLLPQIIANRVSLIMVDKKKARLLKWVLFLLISSVNISVFCIWIPAHMGSGSTFVTLNLIWERVEKTFFLVVDLGLNLYFLYLVRYRLIANGLTKYMPLFKFNAAIVFVSTSMDILLLGLLSLPNPYDYVQFAPVAYIIKLNIELTMAILISKVVRNSSDRNDEWYSDENRTPNGTHLTSRTATGAPMPQRNSFFPGSGRKKTNTCEETASGHWPTYHCEQGQCKSIVTAVTTVAESGDGSCKGDRSQEGIMKSVTMAVRTEDGKDKEECSITARLT
ncbi:hypothetical protein K469DRAFT_633258 [Zopfia rhizophila CBS 207.26]|uniref:Integral membrane protein n=1 Tax=Zopfia rhizophila CBS 207.26 TaxID=1314779 RepID=A0A6A6E0J8_9PEZI|nr:hypothetical protein K469DRAFT_633258 [Zopfia rhizophila CBS 207.26]